jgi:hypothetical protein
MHLKYLYAYFFTVLLFSNLSCVAYEAMTSPVMGFTISTRTRVPKKCL